MKQKKHRSYFILILIIINLINIITFPKFIVEAQSSEVEIISHSYYEFLGRSYVVGEVKNIGSNYLENIIVLVTFYDENNTVLTTSLPAYPKISILEPNEKAPFLASSFPAFDLDVDHYEIEINDYAYTSFNPYRSFRISNLITEIQDEYFYISGQVENIGFVNATWVGIVATYYNDQGIVIGTSTTNLDPGDVKRREKAYFEISTYPRIINPDSYTLQVHCRESDQYPSIISCEISSQSQFIWSNFTIYGGLYPNLPNEEITIKYYKPDGSSYTKIVYTESDGSYSDTIYPGMIGEWGVKTYWGGNELYISSIHSIIKFNVLDKILTTISCNASSYTTYTGNIVNITGHISPILPDKNVYVTYTKPDESKYTKTTITNKNGTYIDEIYPIEIGIWSVQTSWAGDSQYKNSTSSIIIFKIIEPEPITNITTKTGVLKFIIQDLKENNIKEVTIYSIKQPEIQDQIFGETDFNGLVIFDEVMVGNYTFIISKNGYNNITKNISVFEGDINLKIIQMEAIYSSLIVTVKDTDNNLLDKTIIISINQPHEQSTISGISDQNGKIIFTELISGKYIFSIRKEGYENITSLIHIEENIINNITITINKLIIYGKVILTVKDENNNNLEGVNITLINDKNVTVTIVQTPVNGSIKFFNIKEGNYTIIINKKGYKKQTNSINIIGEDSTKLIIELNKDEQNVRMIYLVTILFVITSGVILEFRYKVLSKLLTLLK